MKKNTVVGGAIILTIASLFTRILGFIYRVYMSNLIGAEGMGLFQLVFPVYMLSHTICCSGASIAISRLVAEEHAKKQYPNMRKILRGAVFSTLFIGLGLSCVLFTSAPFIGRTLLNAPRTILGIRILTFALPFSVVSTCIRAYFYGLKDMSVPAVSQVIEQITRMVVIFLIAGFFIPKGLEYACAMAVVGTIAGEIASFLHVYSCYKMESKKTSKKYSNGLKFSLGYRTLLASIAAIAIPITANRTVTTLLQSVENIIIPLKLQNFGLSSSEAISVFGQFTGMALPLLFFPSIFTNSLSTTLLPTVSEANAVQNTRRLEYTISKSLQINSLIGIGSTCLFMTFARPLGTAIYNQQEVGNMLFSLSFICPFLFFQATLNSILNGLGEQMVTFRHNIMALCIRISMIYFLIPLYGLNAYLLALFISYILLVFLNLNKILNLTSMEYDIKNWLLKPCLSALAAGLTSNYVANHYIFNHFDQRTGLIFSIALLGVIYLFFVFSLRCITKEDIHIIKRAF